MLHDMRDYLREMNLSDFLADEMLRIEPDRVRKLARAELNAYGLGEGGPTEDTQKKAVAREILAMKGAEAYGLSRIEYMRRDALIDRTCKLDINTRPGDAFDFDELTSPPDFDTWAPEKKLEHYIQTEETGWSRCYKRIMSNGE
jgi:hypothetical protein